MSTHAKVGSMEIGQNVSIPTKAWGTWTGVIIDTRELGPYAAEGDFMVTIRDDNGTETEVRSNRKWSGYIHNEQATEEEQSQNSDQATSPRLTKTEAAYTLAIAIYAQRKRFAHRMSAKWHERPTATEIATVIAGAPEGSRVAEAGAIRPADRTIRAQYNLVKLPF